jgi:hypothetical protein
MGDFVPTGSGNPKIIAPRDVTMDFDAVKQLNRSQTVRSVFAHAEAAVLETGHDRFECMLALEAHCVGSFVGR